MSWIPLLGPMIIFLLFAAGPAHPFPFLPRVKKMPGATARVIRVKPLISASGIAFPGSSFIVSTRRAGLIEAIRVEEGDRVVKGQTVARLSDVYEMLELNYARAALLQAEAEKRRAGRRAGRVRRQPASPSGSTATAPYESQGEEAEPSAEEGREGDASSLVEVRRARLERAQQLVEDSNLITPIGGVVTRKFATPGSWLERGRRVLEVADLYRIIVRVNLPPSQAVLISAGDEAVITTEMAPGQKFKGRVLKVHPTADLSTGSISVDVGMKNLDWVLKPGAAARLTFSLLREKEVLAVPREALIDRPGGTALFALVNGRAEERTVRTGISSGEWVEINSGVAPGDVVLIPRGESLRSGDRVRVTTER